MGDGKPFRAGRELLRLMLGMSPHTLPAVILALVEHVPQHLNPAGERLLVQRGLALAKRMRQLLGDDGILLFPPHPTTAPLVTRALSPSAVHRGASPPTWRLMLVGGMPCLFAAHGAPVHAVQLLLHRHHQHPRAARDRRTAWAQGGRGRTQEMRAGKAQGDELDLALFTSSALPRSFSPRTESTSSPARLSLLDPAWPGPQRPACRRASRRQRRPRRHLHRRGTGPKALFLAHVPLTHDDGITAVHRPSSSSARPGAGCARPLCEVAPDRCVTSRPTAV